MEWSKIEAEMHPLSRAGGYERAEALQNLILVIARKTETAIEAVRS